MGVGVGKRGVVVVGLMGEDGRGNIQAFAGLVSERSREERETERKG